MALGRYDEVNEYLHQLNNDLTQVDTSIQTGWVMMGSERGSNIGQFRDNNQYLEKTFAYLNMPNNMYKGTLAVERWDDIDYGIGV